VTDLLVAGPYMPEYRCNASLLGSMNQRLIDLAELRGSGTSVQRHLPQMIEIVITPDGTCTATGFPEDAFFKGFEEQGMIKQDSMYVSLQSS
jgi:hypothetical protein